MSLLQQSVQSSPLVVPQSAVSPHHRQPLEYLSMSSQYQAEDEEGRGKDLESNSKHEFRDYNAGSVDIRPVPTQMAPALEKRDSGENAESRPLETWFNRTSNRTSLRVNSEFYDSESFSLNSQQSSLSWGSSTPILR
jgi:hypothetical protein